MIYSKVFSRLLLKAPQKDCRDSVAAGRSILGAIKLKIKGALKALTF
jgi:hypothetical protein